MNFEQDMTKKSLFYGDNFSFLVVMRIKKGV